MSQNQKYKLKYDELREGNPTARQSDENEGNKLHNAPSPSRTICFVWPDGRQQFFSYSYLISGELNVEDDMNLIILRFTSDLVTLKGYGLVELFSQLVKQQPSRIVQGDPRYASTEDAYSIVEISIVPIT